MDEYWIAPSEAFDGDRLRDDLALWISDGRVARLSPVSEVPSEAVVERVEGIVSPGFVDLQVNGGGGVLFNQTPTVQGIEAIVEAHRSVGTVAILPTVITDAREVLEAAADAAIAAFGARGVAGLHIEGPHIAEARRGTHAARFVRPLDQATIALARRVRDAGLPLMLTLAPEAASVAQIAVLAEMGVVVSIGHSDATAAVTREAMAAGAECFTHLFNAMPPMFNREPGVVGAAINSDVYCGIICDGHHVSDEMLAMAIRARPVADKMFLVSDAMPTVAGPDQFDLYGQQIALQGGKLVNEEGSLAGAHVTQLQGVARLVSHVGLGVGEALRMAITVPASAIGQARLAQLQGRELADLVVLSKELDQILPLPAPSAIAS